MAYFTNCGDADGPILRGQIPSAIGVYSDPEARGSPVGIAFSAGAVQGLRGSAVAVFTLTVRDVIDPDLWTCDRREFRRLGEAAELL